MQLLKHFHELSLHPKNAKALKALILQLAVQGKLTAQWRKENPNVEPAEKLLDQVKEEKARLVREKKVKKEKPLPKIEASEKWAVLPVGWEFVRLGEIGDWGAGATPLRSNSEFYDGKINWYKSGELNDAIIDYDSEERITELAVKKTSVRLNKPGDILIAMYGATIGKTALLNTIGTTNQAVCACTCFSCIANFYLHLLLKALRQDFLNQGEGGAQPNISRIKIRHKVIGLPPLEEQKAIVKVVEQLFKEVEQLEQLTQNRIRIKEQFAVSALRDLTTNNTPQEWEALRPHFHSFFNTEANIKKLRETILQLAVQGKLTARWRKTHSPFEGGTGNPDDHDAALLLEKIKAEKAHLIHEGKIKKEKPLPEITADDLPAGKAGIPYKLPEGWVWCRLDDIASIIGGVAKGKKINGKTLVTPYLRVANVQRGFLDLEIVKEIQVSKADYDKYQLADKDLLMIEGGDPDKLGRCAIWNNEIPGCIHQNHVFRVRAFSPGGYDELYMMKFLNSRLTRDYYEDCAKRTTNLASINKTQMRSTPVYLPPLNEQKGIVETVNHLMALCDRLEQECTQRNAQAEKWMKSAVREVLGG